MTYQELKNNIIKIVKREEPLISIYYFFQGKIRYRLYYSKYKCLIRKHILEQIEYRIKIMNKECYSRGSCIKCGCETTALQMCNKPCKGLEYPPIVNRRTWKQYYHNHCVIRWNDMVWLITQKNQLAIFKETNIGYEQKH